MAAPVVGPVVVQGRRAVQFASAARAAAALWVQEGVSETVIRAQLLQKLADSTYANVKVRGVRACADEAVGSAREVVCQSATSAKCSVQDAIAATSEVCRQPVFKTSVVAAAAGSSTLGAVGVTAGVVMGGMAGGLAGLPLALFTFGLSIPIGAVMGGTAGGALGLVSGAAVGLVSGGAIGYTGFKKQDALRELGVSAMGNVNDSKEYVKSRALASADYTREAIKATKERLRRTGTGGTTEASN